MTSARLVFQLGDFKTETTALQNWLTNQADRTEVSRKIWTAC